MSRKIVEHRPLTSYELATLLISVSGLISLFFIAKQVQTANRQVRVSIKQAKAANQQAEAAKTQTQALTTQTVMNQLLELDKLFIKDPDLRPYFYYGKDMGEGDGRYDKAIAVAEFQLDFFDSFITQEQYLTLSSADKKNWEDYIARMFILGPIMCKRLKEVREWYSEKLAQLANCQ